MAGRSRCRDCGRDAGPLDARCECGGRVLFDYPYDTLDRWTPSGRGLGRYAPLLPDYDASVDMGEGATPLAESRRIGPSRGIRLYFKLESLNPTGSYKDRIASVGAALARAHGRRVLIATSSGNAGAAIAAYAARAGLAAVLVVPEHAPQAKLTQIAAYGAVIVAVRGALAGPAAVRRMFDAVTSTAQTHGWLPMITAYRFAPAAMDGVKTLALEIVETLSAAPDYVYVPVGGGGLLAATWRGFTDARALGWSATTPRLVAVQPEGCAPVVRSALGLPPRNGEVTTTVSGLQVADPPDGDLAVEAITASEGSAVMVSDAAVHAAQRALARDEGIFAEPAGAASLAGLLTEADAGNIARGSVAVCVVTGTGFKDLRTFPVADDVPVLDVQDLDQLGDIAGRMLLEQVHRSGV
jgi:threonine synthase